MKKTILFIIAAALTIGGVALAGDYLTYQTTLVAGSAASNGNSSAAPTLATQGISVKSTQTIFGNPIATVCRVTAEQIAGNTFQDDKAPVNGQWFRGWRYSGSDPLGGTAGWSRAQWLDLSVTAAIDAGTGKSLSGSDVSGGLRTLSFQPFNLLPGTTEPYNQTATETATARYYWSSENIEEDAGTGTGADAGIGLLIECYTQ